MSLQPHQQRVVDEKAELDGKIVKLVAFFETPIFANIDPDEHARLKNQVIAMTTYSSILAQRIAAF